ncbi:MAG: STAS domain-containing protein [Thermoguttaceae bacterium]
MRRVEAAIVVTFLPGQIINTLSTEQVDDLVSAVAAVSRVVANLAHFRFIPTQLLGTLVRLSRRMAKAGSRFNLCRLSPEAWAALKVTALDRIFEIHDDEASAFASF